MITLISIAVFFSTMNLICTYRLFRVARNANEPSIRRKPAEKGGGDVDCNAVATRSCPNGLEGNILAHLSSDIDIVAHESLSAGSARSTRTSQGAINSRDQYAETPNQVKKDLREIRDSILSLSKKVPSEIQLLQLIRDSIASQQTLGHLDESLKQPLRNAIDEIKRQVEIHSEKNSSEWDRVISSSLRVLDDRESRLNASILRIEAMLESRNLQLAVDTKELTKRISESQSTILASITSKTTIDQYVRLLTEPTLSVIKSIKAQLGAVESIQSEDRRIHAAHFAGISQVLDRIDGLAKNLEPRSFSELLSSAFDAAVARASSEFEANLNRIQDRHYAELTNYFKQLMKSFEESLTNVEAAKELLENSVKLQGQLAVESKSIDIRSKAISEQEIRLSNERELLSQEVQDSKDLLCKRDSAVLELEQLHSLKQQLNEMQKPAILEDPRILNDLRALQPELPDTRIIFGAIYQFDACLAAVRKIDEAEWIQSLQDAIYSLSRVLLRHAAKNKGGKSLTISIWLDAVSALTQRWFENRLPIAGRPIDWEWMSSSNSGVVKEVATWAVLSKVSGILNRKAEVK